MGVVFARSSFSVDRLAKKSKLEILYEHDAVLRALGRPELTGEERMTQRAKTNYDMARAVGALMRELPEPPSRLVVKDRQDRDDGRFYIPITNGSGTIVARVPSDAFDADEEKAKAFAESLRDAYNLVVAG